LSCWRNPSLWLALACDLPGFESTSDTVQGVLGELEQVTGLRATLATPDSEGRAIVKIAWYLPLTTLGLTPRCRAPLPAHATAIGLVYLASLPRSDLRQWVAGRLRKCTDRTIRSRPRLMQELALVRRQGYCVCRGTFIADSTALAVPVRDGPGKTVASISLGGRTELVTEDVIRECLPLLLSASQRLGRLAQAAPLGAGESERPSTSDREPRRRVASRNGWEPAAVRSVERAVRITQALWRARRPERLADISRKLGLHRTTALRLLRTLVALGVVHVDPASGRYCSSPVAWLGVSYDLRKSALAADTVEKLLSGVADATGMVAWLATPNIPALTTTIAAAAAPSTWSNADARRGPPPSHDPGAFAKIYLKGLSPEAIERLSQALGGPASGMRLDTRRRVIAPMHCTASGKVFLASLSPARLRQQVRSDPPAMTSSTITSLDLLVKDLAQVRKQGYAVSREEALPGIWAVAVPVRDCGGRTVASMGIAGPAHLMKEPLIPRWFLMLRRASDRITGLLNGIRPGAGANPA
jgi:DNA-binding IclR family transcriptional regulator